MKYEITDKNGKELHVGDKILLRGRDNLFDDNTIATVKFGFYDDGEGYSTLKHFGWYVEYDHSETHSLGDLIENCEIL